MTQKFEKLRTLLKELFQLDQPDLDFGLYRIMHAKSAEVTQFLEKDLLPQVRAEFGRYKTADKTEIEQQLARAIEQAAALGADPETLPKVKELRARLTEDAVDLNALESEVYDHLYSFFRRYYSEGDFLSKRVYKPGVYAIPYEGEEVKLHWANADQYYIKTSEYLRDYAFRLRPEDDANPMRVHFRLVDAAEGEHGNVKAAEGKDRVFILAVNDFIAEEDGEQGKELVIRFEYRPATLTDWPNDVRNVKKKSPTQKELTDLAEARIAAVRDKGLAKWIAELEKTHEKADGERADYSRLHAHLNRYVARNTFDYFIHKDLGAFLRRELDFYVKNEVMHLDDIENESVPRVEQYLSKIKAIRRIAIRIIEFLSQLEEFQKKLWLKKKFVVETNYCISLAIIPEHFHTEIAANKDQLAEWCLQGTVEKTHHESLFHDDDTAVSLAPEVIIPKSAMIDTKHFSEDFTTRLIMSVGNLQSITDGVLFHSENFQALSLMQARYRNRIESIHIDPPYNTQSSGFLYRNNYQHSSWLSMLYDRVAASVNLLQETGSYVIHIDEYEVERLSLLLEQFAIEDAGTMVWDKGMPIAGTKGLATQHEYVLFLTKGNAPIRARKKNIDKIKEQARNILAKRGSATREAISEFRGWLRQHADSFSKAELTYDQFDDQGRVFRSDNMSATDRRQDPKYHIPLNHPVTANPCPVPDFGWRYTPESIAELIKDDLILFGESHDSMPRKKTFIEKTTDSQLSTLYRSGLRGKTDLDNVGLEFPYAHPVEMYSYVLDATLGTAAIALDYFAGSGTTGHAVIKLNRGDGGRRRFVLTEMGAHFDTVLIPRLKRAALSPDWKDGVPVRWPTAEEIEAGPRMYKYVRLESYEDALNNLQLRRSGAQKMLLETASDTESSQLKEEYILRYMLNVETAGSQSLLNVRGFSDPTAYRLKIKRPGSDESREVNVDLLETFNWLIGLTVQHIAAPQCFQAKFERDDEGRLQLKGRLKQVESSSHWFRTVTGTTPDGRKTLVIWRKRPGGETPEGVEQDNLVLDEWFTRQGYSSKDSEFDLIYVNGTNNLENLRAPDDTWKVRLIEDDFHRLMFASEGI